VSTTAHAFVELLYTTLADMVSATTPAAAAQLFFATRDMCDLFRALLPESVVVAFFSIF
jgi:hypothetical protein